MSNSLTTNFEGYISRLSLDPSPENALFPVYEAVSNSLHAIEDRFASKGQSKELGEKGRITIEVIREYTGGKKHPVTGFTISDNGCGFVDEDFCAFHDLFTQRKIDRGGKGVGRMTWLKVFKSISVYSSYIDSDKLLKHRAFDFTLRGKGQIEERETRDCPRDEPGTIVKLHGFIDEFSLKCPKKNEDLERRFIAHFLLTFASDHSPRIELRDGSVTLDLNMQFRADLNAQFKKKQRDQSEEEIKIYFDDSLDNKTFLFTIKHMRCDESIFLSKSKDNKHRLILAAHGRGVEEHAIGKHLGLELINGEEVYLGVVSSSFLDGFVNSQRTTFDITDDKNEKIRQQVVESAQKYLHKFIKLLQQKKEKTALDLINKYPTFLPLKKNIEKILKELPPASTKEEIYAALSTHSYQRQQELYRLKSTIQSAHEYTQEIEEKIKTLQEGISEDQRGALATYVIKRKVILNMLERMKGFSNPERKKHHLEKAVHQLICPMKITSQELKIESHNLWILDERLAFSSFFASDKPLKDYMNTDSSSRPDILFLYESCMAWRQGEHADSVVLVEFKRPGRDDYSPDDNPIRQIMGYINELKDEKTTQRDSRGGVISNVSERTAFECHIVADLTATLKNELWGLSIVPTPDNRGLFGYIENPKASVGIIPYDKLLGDAQQRNAILFHKLGLDG